jgi:hypothetical protein
MNQRPAVRFGVCKLSIVSDIPAAELAHLTNTMRETITTHAVEIKRLHNRIKESYRNKDKSGDHRDRWLTACQEFIAATTTCVSRGLFDRLGRQRST